MTPMMNISLITSQTLKRFRTLNHYPLQLRIPHHQMQFQQFKQYLLHPSILSMATLAPQDRWFRDKHIELVSIVDFLSEEEPKKVSEALKHPGWVDAMQEELN
ncbi:hypothetical protein Tco_1549067 [Tanacetum coccineum]